MHSFVTGLFWDDHINFY